MSFSIRPGESFEIAKKRYERLHPGSNLKKVLIENVYTGCKKNDTVLSKERDPDFGDVGKSILGIVIGCSGDQVTYTSTKINGVGGEVVTVPRRSVEISYTNPESFLGGKKSRRRKIRRRKTRGRKTRGRK